MKKLIFLISSLLLITVTSCKTSGYKIEGSTTNNALNGTQVYLREYGSNHPAIDSCTVKNKKFLFKGKQPLPVLRLVEIAPDNLKEKIANNEILQPGIPGNGEFYPYSLLMVLEDKTFNVCIDSFSVVSGTPANDAWQQVRNQLKAIDDEASALLNKVMSSTTSTQEDEEKFENYPKQKQSILTNHIAANLNQLSAGYLYSKCYMKIDPDEQLAWFDKTDSVFRSVPGVQEIINGRIAERNTAPGNPLTDFTMCDPDGKEWRISDFVKPGQYVLLDFWSSWCAPCCAVMPEVIRLHDTYNEKGLTVIGISLDYKKEAWVNAIKRLKINFLQLSDLKPKWQNKAAGLYNISGIPSTVLISPEGKIIFKGHSLKDLETELKKVLK